jgi:hypothetical protein
MLGLAGPRLYGAIAGAVVVALFLAWVMRVNHLRGQYKAALAACEANHKQFVADVQAKTAEAQRLDAEHKAQVETNQDKITKEENSASTDRIERYRTAARVQPVAAKANPSRSGTAPVPKPTEAASGIATEDRASELPAADRLICATNTGIAEGWQEWWAKIDASRDDR